MVVCRSLFSGPIHKFGFNGFGLQVIQTRWFRCLEALHMIFHVLRATNLHPVMFKTKIRTDLIRVSTTT